MPLLLLILLQEYLAICRCSHSKPSSSANKLLDSCTSLEFFNRAFFCEMMDSTFSILSADLIASICSWKVLFTSGLFLVWLICSLRKIILRRLFAVEKISPLLYLVNPSSRSMVITRLAPLRDGVYYITKTVVTGEVCRNVIIIFKG